MKRLFILPGKSAKETMLTPIRSSSAIRTQSGVSPTGNHSWIGSLDLARRMAWSTTQYDVAYLGALPPTMTMPRPLNAGVSTPVTPPGSNPPPGYLGASRLNFSMRRLTMSTSTCDMRLSYMTKSFSKSRRVPAGSDTPRSVPRDLLNALARLIIVLDGLIMFLCDVVSLHSGRGLGTQSSGFCPTMGFPAQALSQFTGLVPQPFGAAINVVVSLSLHRQYPAAMVESLPQVAGFGLT
mmetsp:Transcript_4779/g.10375  ORF Transcript_4779/g.10375 Transcript_4779/m.10375 type:complete len:238 (-) Transcript_4779:269-982(-)